MHQLASSTNPKREKRPPTERAEREGEGRVSPSARSVETEQEKETRSPSPRRDNVNTSNRRRCIRNASCKSSMYKQRFLILQHCTLVFQKTHQRIQCSRGFPNLFREMAPHNQAQHDSWYLPCRRKCQWNGTAQTSAVRILWLAAAWVHV